MSATSISPPFPIFSDSDGQPLENGYIWIGTANLNPQVNPINVYWDADLLVPAGQPIRTLGGYPSNNGTPARIFISASDSSILVQNKNGGTVYSSPASTERYSGADISFGVQNATGNGTQTVFLVTANPTLIYIGGIYQNQNTYTVNGLNVTFSQAPPLNSIIEFLI